MKAGLFTLLAAALLPLAVAQPHGLQQKHRHHVRQAVENHVDWYVEEVIVYVDADGKAVSTTTIIEPAPKTTSTTTPAAVPTVAPVQPTTLATSTSAPAPPASSPAPPAPPASSPAPAPAPSSSPSPLPVSSAAAPAQSSSPAPAQGAGFGSAIAYSPYNNDGTCKSLSQVSTDVASMASYQVIRLYEPSCNQIANVIAATKGKNVQIFAGVLGLDKGGAYSPSVLQSQVDDLISQVNGDWGVINTVNIGNELVNAGKTSTSEVVGRVNQYRQQLRSKGYNGPVVTVDTMVAMRSHIELCTASDYCAINCHAFYDGNVTPDGTGNFVLNFVQQISQLAGGKTTVVTESGWPSQGPSIGKAVASPENQQAAVASLKATFANNLVLYNAYNNLWFSDPSLQYWGIYGAAPA